MGAWCFANEEITHWANQDDPYELIGAPALACRMIVNWLTTRSGFCRSISRKWARYFSKSWSKRVLISIRRRRTSSTIGLSVFIGFLHLLDHRKGKKES